MREAGLCGSAFFVSCLTCVTGNTAFSAVRCYHSVKVLWKIILLQVIMKSFFS